MVDEKLKTNSNANKAKTSINPIDEYAKFIAEMIKKYQAALIKG